MTPSEIVGFGPHDGIRITLETEKTINAIVLISRTPDGDLATTLTNQCDACGRFGESHVNLGIVTLEIAPDFSGWHDAFDRAHNGSRDD